ncbi:MAG: DUF1501 domain-containing protein [Myxococcota bacterium]|nr:DUF1501 domain-containing protein [Myxococcota bacterium]
MGGFGPLGRLARATGGAATGSDQYYVFCYFGGGWDILLSLDPRDPLLFHEGNVKNTLIQPGYEFIEDFDTTLLQGPGDYMLGPFMGELAQHLDKLAIVRGMSMETLTHAVGRRRFITGKPPAGLSARGSSGATWLASALGSEHAIPNLAMRVETYNADQPNYATGLSVSTVDDLLRALRPSDPALSQIERQQVDELLSNMAACPNALRSPFWQSSEESRIRSQDMVAAQLDSLFDFMANTDEMGELRDHYDIANANDARSSARAQAAVAAQALKGGVSRVVSVQLTGNLDTHFEEWATDQGPRQMEGFDAVARLVEDLGSSQYKDTSETWLDHTTIIGFSEFCRGALMNSRGGRDHSLTNACFLIGGNVQGGQVIGRSSDVGMAPTPTNLTTGQWDLEFGEVIRPEHVLRTLMVDAGIEEDDADLRVDPITALLKP